MFKDYLKKLRLEKGLTQIELAKELFVNQKTISLWENGLRVPDYYNANKIAEFYKIAKVKLIEKIIEEMK